ncbi:MAG TPA: winged helix DNA-binding domain-containing protein [Chloroflexia bacterium]|nr:winged helix DNA-binding domain-containing protein [Chloroflexia bacterium]
MTTRARATAGPPSVPLTWDQVHAVRLARLHLAERAAPGALLEVVAAIGGLQAQVLSAAELAAWARVRDLTRSEFREALWEQRTLVKTWAMRGTLHLLATAEYPTIVAALSTRTGYRRPIWLRFRGLTLEEMDACTAAVGQVLTDGRPRTRDELAAAVTTLTGSAAVGEKLLSGWGELLKPASGQGMLCFGPSAGQVVTFVSPEVWLGPWERVDPAAALQATFERFLRTFGPTTLDEFARWWGVQPAEVRRLWNANAAQLAPVEIEGRKAWALPADMRALQIEATPRTVRLLPHFDPYTLAAAPYGEPVYPAAEKARIYRTAGWVSPCVLVDGRLAGVWEMEKQRNRLAVQVTLFGAEPQRVTGAVKSEADLLGAFLDAPVDLTIA